MSRPSTRALLQIAAVGAMVAALGLAGCGRKGGLDPPPGGTALSPAPVAEAPPGPAVMPDGKPLAPQAPRRSTIIDFLID